MPIDPASLSILCYPDARLREMTEPVDPANEKVRAVARRMIELMHEAEGVGLAAPQVGLPWRLFVTHSAVHDPVDRVFVNPELTLERGEMISAEEGCLSLPGINVEVRRANRVTIRAVDLEGKTLRIEAEGFLARVWQHEFDHLNRTMIIDRMSMRDRLATRKALRELAAMAQASQKVL